MEQVLAWQASGYRLTCGKCSIFRDRGGIDCDAASYGKMAYRQELNMAFRKFTEHGAASRDGVTLRANGYVFVPKGVLKRFEALDAQSAVTYFDEDTKRLGIKFLLEPAESAEEGARKLIHEKAGRSVNVMPLLRYYGIASVEKSHLQVSREDDMLVLDIAKLWSRAGQ